MTKQVNKLTLDRPVTYEIKVPGQIDASWSDWVGDMTITVDSVSDDEGNSEGHSYPVTTLIGKLDQAALQGLLRRLYGLGLPLISVACIECGLEDSAHV